MSKANSTCSHCGKSFVYNAADRSGKYCSQRCHIQGKRANRPHSQREDGCWVIPLTHGTETVIDDAGYERIKHLGWHLKGLRKYERYAATKIKGKRRLMHHLLMDIPAGFVVDHINSDTLDNRQCNLRLATPADNARNAAAKGSKTGYRGVSRNDKTKKKYTKPYFAQIESKGKTLHLGCFTDPSDAANAYDRKARELHGEFARLNFPDIL